ncbi:MAG: Uma2 family endonuclease [Prosthecobacter sp.]|uniref:Uma2 family endonuclease n=1 Tax=Prosthecobacter sp. TaxID=1965333 RepID=UPI0039043EEF
MVATASIAELPLARITCEKYHALIQSGAFTEDDRLELINGYLVQKMSIGPNHAGAVKALNFLLNRRLGDRAIVAVQDPITINEYSEPEPDIVIARFRDDFYRQSHPGPGDVILVIEVADSSLSYDLTAKIPLYAAAGIPEAWLVNLNARQMTVFRQPEGAAYTQSEVFKDGDTVAVPGFADVTLRMDELGI